jgi:HlyD family secretion protein
MKKFLNVFIVGLFFLTVGFITYKEVKKQEQVPVFLLGTAQRDSIKVERRIYGKIRPAEEIKVKSKINGVVEKVYVEIGQKIKEGERIAFIKKLSEPMEIEDLKTRVSLYEIQLETARLQYQREKELAASGLTSDSEFETIKARFNEATEQLESAKKRLQMATSGMVTLDRSLSNTIYAPASGTILSLISRSGSPVIKQNNYNEGTTIATIANMDSLKFYGNIFERDLLKIKEGQPIELETLHTGSSSLAGRIDKIYPKGIEENGIVKFPIEASISSYPGKLWGGMNATAVIITDSVNNALCIEEKYLVYENNSCYAWVRDEDNQYRKTNLVTGLSDGLKTQIVKGLNENDKVKLPEDD